MKQKINIFKWLAVIIVAAGLLYITESFFISLGVVLLLIVIEHVLIDRVDDYRRKKDKDINKE